MEDMEESMSFFVIEKSGIRDIIFQKMHCVRFILFA